MTNEDRFNSLTRKELEVLFYMEQGNTEEEIAEILKIGVGTVRYRKNIIYDKFGIDKNGEFRRQNAKAILIEHFYPILRVKVPNEEAVINWRPKRSLGPENPELEGNLEVKPEENPIPAPSIFFPTTHNEPKPDSQESFSEEVEKALEKRLPPEGSEQPEMPSTEVTQPRPTPSQTLHTHRRETIAGITAIIVVCGLIALGIGVITRQFWPARTPATPSATAPGTASQVAISTSTLPATTIPCDAYTPTAPNTAMFEDNFDSGLSPQWEVLSGEPVVANGQLTTDQPTWLSVGNPCWKNYRVEYVTYNLSNISVVGLRSQGLGHMVFATYSSGDELYWSTQEGNKARELPNSRRQFPWDGTNNPVNYALIAQNNEFSLLVNGKVVTSVNVENYSTGKVSILLNTRTIIDNFKVTALP